MTLVQIIKGKLYYLPVILLSTYVIFIALILNPQIQAHNVFLHSINIPFHYDISQTDNIKSLSSFSGVRNFQVEAIDGIRISGWHLLPDKDADDDDIPIESTRFNRDALFDQSLRERPTILYFHGNAMNRAASFRIKAYAMFTFLGLNVIAIDYRGFGDSQGIPSEQGLQKDARAAYKWIRQRQDYSKSNEKERPALYIAGQSLGTGVAARLALDLYHIGESPHTIFLLAPYTSINNLLTSYKIGGLIPLFWPLGLWKVLSNLANRYLYTRFESEKALYQLSRQEELRTDEIKRWGNLDYTLSKADLIQELGLMSREIKSTLSPRSPNIIISHADDDAVIPHAHGRSLFDTVVMALGQSGSKQKIEEEEQNWGTSLILKDADRSYTLIKSHKGGHNGIPKHALQIFSNIAGLIPIKAE